MRASGLEFTGNGADDRTVTLTTSLGGVPDLVVVKRMNGLGTSKTAYCRFSTMTGDLSKRMMLGEAALANRIQAFPDVDQFQVSNDQNVNRNGNAHDVWAFRDDGLGGFTVFSYLGDGGGNRSGLTGGNFDFQTALSWVVPESTTDPVWACDEHTVGQSQEFDGALISTGILALGDGEITVHSNYNVNGVLYHVAVWSAGAVSTIPYTGNGLTDQRYPHGLPATPIGAYVQGLDSTTPISVWRMQSTALGTGGSAQIDGGTFDGGIDLIDATNVGIDNHAIVNEDTKLFIAIAWPPSFEASNPSAAVTGTAASGLTENDVRGGGDTIIVTLTDDTWVASGATFNAQRQAIIDGLDSAQAEAAGWNAEVRDALPVTAVVRTSDTVVTITLPALADYQITAQETVTVTVPAAALSAGGALVAAPTFTIEPSEEPVPSGGGGATQSAGATAQQILNMLRTGSAGSGYPRPLHVVLNDIAEEMGAAGGAAATPERAAQRILAHLQGVAAPAGVQGLDRSLQQIVVALGGEAGGSVEDNLAKWLALV